MNINCESVYSSSSAVKQTSETLRETINPVLLFYLCWLYPQLSSFWRKTDFSQLIWPAGDQLTTTFTILNCLEYEFLKGFLVQGRQQPFWKFSILSNILDLQWCLPNVFTTVCHVYLPRWRDGKGGKLSSQASKMLYKLPGAVYILVASYKEVPDQSDCWKLFVQLWNYTNLAFIQLI